MNFEPGYLETDAPGAIFPMIRDADSVLEYSHVFRKARPKNELAILRGTSRILEIRELTFTKQRQGSNFSRRTQSDSPQTHIGTLPAPQRRQKSTLNDEHTFSWSGCPRAKPPRTCSLGIVPGPIVVFRNVIGC